MYLNEFYQTKCDEIKTFWSLKEIQLEDKIIRIELHFQTGNVIFTEKEDNRFALVTTQIPHKVVYEHTSYLLELFSNYYLLENQKSSLTIEVFGMAYQAILGIKNFKIELIEGKGTIASIDRFNNPKETIITKPQKVIITAK
jgi:hypothetical protein